MQNVAADTKAPPVIPVDIKNTTATPVPVVQQGVTTVSGAVNATITNTPTVNLAPGSAVQIQEGGAPFS